MIVKDDEIAVVTDEDVTTQEEEVIEETETSEESEPAVIQDEEEEDRVVTIDGSSEEGEADKEEHTETPGWVKKVRKVNRKLESENKRLKRQLEEKAEAAEAEKPIELGEKPTLANHKYDDASYEADLQTYWDRKRKVENQAAEKAKTVDDQNKVWMDRKEHYTNLKQEHSFKDFKEAEETVVNIFSQTQQSILIQGADDAALVVYALGKNPKKLEELAKITNPVDFAFKVSKLETQLKVTNKKAPAPEKRVTAGNSGGMGGNADKVLEKLREEGDFTKINAYKQKIRNKDK